MASNCASVSPGNPTITSVESAIPGTGRLRFIEVKGRVAGADTVTVTKNEILYSLNKPDEFILAMVAFGADGSHEARYLRRPFHELREDHLLEHGRAILEVDCVLILLARDRLAAEGAVHGDVVAPGTSRPFQSRAMVMRS